MQVQHHLEGSLTQSVPEVAKKPEITVFTILQIPN